MNKSNILKLALAFASVAANMFATGETTAQPPPKSPATLQGVWRVTRHGVNCQTGQELNSFPALMTFHQDGTLHGDAVGPGSTAAESTAEHGVWAPHGSDYSFRAVGYTWDPDTGVFEGRGEITAIVHLTSANTFTYNATICVYDAVGNQLFCACGRSEGIRF